MATKHLGATMALSGVPSQFYHLGAYSDGKGNNPFLSGVGSDGRRVIKGPVSCRGLVGLIGHGKQAGLRLRKSSV